MTHTDDLLPVGLADRLPRDAARITHAMRACLGVLETHSYQRVRPPMLEFEKSLAGRMGEGVGEDDAQKRRMFRMTDPASLRTLALRADITPQIGRIASTGMADAPRPLRLAYCGETVVMAADQLDPARERLQLGGELIGADSVAACAEIVAVAVEALQAAGLAGISIDFTLPDLVITLAQEALPLEPSVVEAVQRELDTKDAGGLRDAGGEAYLPLLYATGPMALAIEQLRALDAGKALASRLAGLEAIAAALPVDTRITLDATERHGFEYQSWFGFTLYADGVRGAAGRGGTYQISGSEEVATGFSLYVDRISGALSDGVEGKTLYLPQGHDRAEAAKLRSDGWRTLTAIDAGEDPAALGATHILEGNSPKAL